MLDFLDLKGKNVVVGISGAIGSAIAVVLTLYSSTVGMFKLPIVSP
jgi:hypothetical protein